MLLPRKLCMPKIESRFMGAFDIGIYQVHETESVILECSVKFSWNRTVVIPGVKQASTVMPMAC